MKTKPMTMQRRQLVLKGGFTVLEVVISMAMLALIAVPAVGLAAMAAKKSQSSLSAGTATELKRRVEAAMSAEGVFGARSFDAAVFYASRDLRYIEEENSEGALGPQNDGYFRLTISEPVGYTYVSNDLFRLYVCRMSWPNDPSPGEGTKDLTTLLAFRR